MAAPTGVHVMRNATITIDVDQGGVGTPVEFANSISKARLVPDTPVQTIRTLVPDGVVQDVDSTVWTFEMSGVQVWAASALAKILNENAGNQIDVVLQPKVGSGQDMATFTMVAVPVEFGGEQGNFRTFEAEFPVVGQPVFSTSV